jgi:RimJ/RimL family protein N-acetyltransferase
MNFKKYESKKQFLDENLEILIKKEPENELMIGIVLEHDDNKVGKWLLGRIEENDEVKIIFMVDDDKEGLVFYCPNKNITTEHIEFLVYSIINSDTALEQIVGNKEFSKRIGEIYCMKTGKNIIKTSTTHTLVLHEIEQEHILEDNEKLIKLNPEHPSSKKMGQVVKDIHTDIYGQEECSDEEAEKIANIYLKKGLYILTDNNEENVYCHAVTVRKQVNGCAIGAVISPKEYRGKGYGKKCIYALSKELLNKGNKFIVLHVAEKNQPAQSVYSKIGFEFIEETERVLFN